MQSQYGGLPLSTTEVSTTNSPKNDSSAKLHYVGLPAESPNKSANNSVSTNNNLASPTQLKRTPSKSAPVSQYGGLPEPMAPNAPVHVTQYGGLTEHLIAYCGMPNAEASNEVNNQYGGLPDSNISTNSSNGSSGARSSSPSSSSSQSYGGLPGNDPLAQYRGLPSAAPISQYGGLPASSKPMSPSTSSRQQQEFRQKLHQQQLDLVSTQSSKNYNSYLATPEMEDLMKAYQPQ